MQYARIDARTHTIDDGETIQKIAYYSRKLLIYLDTVEENEFMKLAVMQADSFLLYSIKYEWTSDYNTFWCFQHILSKSMQMKLIIKMHFKVFFFFSFLFISSLRFFFSFFHRISPYVCLSVSLFW